jgi:hypothetical protein
MLLSPLLLPTSIWTILFWGFFGIGVWFTASVLVTLLILRLGREMSIEGWTLDRSVNCPVCDRNVKPLVIDMKHKDIGRGDEPFLLVRCPGCEQVFEIFPEGDEELAW